MTVLEWVSVYWFSRAGPAACTRIYYELSHGNTTDLFVGTTWTSVPLGVSYFPKEPIRLPEQYVGPSRFFVNSAYTLSTNVADGHIL